MEYALGFYYFEDDGSFDNYRLAATPVGGVLSSAYDNETEATAFYTQATWTPPILDDKLALTLGYRHTEETKGITYRYLDDGASTGRGLFSGSPLNFRVNLDYTGELFETPTYGDQFDQDFSNDSGSATVAYQLTDDTNVFVRWSTGYRSGGYNGEIYNNPFEEETIEQWELGVKSDIVPGTLRLNASVFSFVYDDCRSARSRSTRRDSRPRTSATRARPSAGAPRSSCSGRRSTTCWSRPAGRTWTAISRSTRRCAARAPMPTSASRPRTRHVARLAADDQLSLVTDWVFASTDWADFMAHVEVFWQDESAASALWTNNYAVAGGTYPYIYDPIMLKDRVVVNARIGIENVELSSGTLRASIWGRNLTDEEYQNFGINFGSLGPITEQYGEPVTYGVDVTFEF